ncbi:hypothetical protein AB4Y45_34700 [Paraburkholderia sp. EG287A]|uniref:hypothetical protein n=1 Tax=Paraburkholderia sp. EG287A TaxID=3237012 RepID=UPI0034D1CA75
MDSKLHIVTTAEHVLHPLRPGEHIPAQMCVTYSVWGVSSIGTIQPGFHIAYLRLKEIQARPIATAPTGAKLLLRPEHGIWCIGSLSADTRRYYVEWAPLPKLPPEMKPRPWRNKRVDIPAMPI